MNIEFGDKDLEELYTTGKTKDQRYRKLPKHIISRYVKVVNYMKGVRRLEDLFLIQYRLLFYSSPDNKGIVVNALIIEISKHYE